jgi:tetratricopeptide (TPR) repeat protein
MDPLPTLPARFAAPTLIGEGSTAWVWQVEDRLCGDYAALKVVRSALARLPRLRGRFAREVALTASIIHPHVVPIRAHGQLDDGRPYCAMAVADARSLAEQEAPAPGLYLRWIDEVLDALAHLHSRGLLHQDLKPENILLYTRPDGQLGAWLTDLGVAGAQVELATTRSHLMGTPAWMAPEQRLGRPQELCPATDLYAVGLILSKLAGFQFTPGRGEGEFPPPGGALRGGEGAPAALRPVLERLLDPDPRRRFDRAADLRRALSTLDGPAPGWARAAAIVAGGWAKVPPGPLPSAPPAPSGLGAPADALSLLALRDPPLRLYPEVAGRLWSAAREVAADGQPRVIVLLGHDDVGKAALLRGVAARLDAGGWMEPLSARYHFPAQADDGCAGLLLDLLAPWGDTRDGALQRVARWLARDQGAHPEDCQVEAAALVRWCGFLAQGEAPVNAGLGVAALLRHLDARSWRGASALFLEDAHLCREPGDGLDLLLALQERAVGERRLLAVATVDTEALAEDALLRARLAALRESGAEVIELPRPTPADLAEQIVGFGFDPDFAAELAPRCNGSPVMAGLLLRDWATRALLERDAAGRLRLRAGLPLDLVASGTLDQLCERRVDGALGQSPVPAEAAEALSLVALAGRVPPVAVLRRVCPEGLDGLLATGLVQQAGGRLRFEHAQIYEVALRRAEVRADVRSLHRRLSEAWEQVGAESGVDVDLPVGRHAFWAGDAGAALHRLLAAGRKAVEAGRCALAVDAAELAVAAAEAAGSRVGLVDALDVLAEAQLELEQPTEALETLEHVGAVDRRAQGRVALLRARARLALGDAAAAGRELERAGQRFAAVRDRRGLAEVACGEGQLLRLQGELGAAARRFGEALSQNKGKDQRLEVVALAAKVECGVLSGGRLADPGELRRLWSLAHSSGDTRSFARASWLTGLLSLDRGGAEAAERAFCTARGLAATLGDDRLRYAAEYALGELLRQQGELGPAALAFGRAARLGALRGWALLEAGARAQRAALLWERDRAAAEADRARAAAALVGHPGHWAVVVCAALAAAGAVEVGDLAAAVEALRAAAGAAPAGLRAEPFLRVIDELRAASVGAPALAQALADAGLGAPARR